MLSDRSDHQKKMQQKYLNDTIKEAMAAIFKIVSTNCYIYFLVSSWGYCVTPLRTRRYSNRER